jgi:hypothetical protein
MPLRNLSSCILFDIGKSYVNQYFYSSNVTAYKPIYVKRKTNIPLVNGYMDSSEEKAINFKVFQYIIPDFFQRELLKSNYFTLNVFKQFLTKNTRFLEIYKKYVFNKTAGSFCRIMFYNNILWIIILILISILLFEVTRNITGPINKISEIVMSLGQESNDEEGISKLSDENFTYSDDKEINDFFLICKNIIKGGFSEDHNNKMNNKENLYYIGLSSNQITYVKTNNLIIDEEKIEEATNASAQAILNYVKKDEIGKERNIEFMDRQETEKLNRQLKRSKVQNRVLYKTEEQVIKYCEYIISMMETSKNNYLYEYLEKIEIRIMNANV